MTVLEFPAKAIGSPGTCEVAGMRMGISCAKEILKKPDVPAVIITSIYLAKLEKVFDQYRASGHLTHEHEVATRRGFDRGVASQMNNPDAKIEIKAI